MSLYEKMTDNQRVCEGNGECLIQININVYDIIFT